MLVKISDMRLILLALLTILFSSNCTGNQENSEFLKKAAFSAAAARVLDLCGFKQDGLSLLSDHHKMLIRNGSGADQAAAWLLAASGDLYLRHFSTSEALACYQQSENLLKAFHRAYNHPQIMDNPDFAALNLRLCCIFFQNRNYEKALSFLNLCEQVLTPAFGEDQPESYPVLINRALIYLKQEKYSSAIREFRSIYSFIISSSPAVSEEAVSAARNLAGAYYYSGEYKKCEELCRYILNLEKLQHSVSLAFSYYNLALCQYSQDKLTDAGQSALSSLDLLSDKNLPVTASVYQLLGDIFHENGGYSKAGDYYQKALEIRKTILGSQHPLTGVSLFCFYREKLHTGEYSAAESGLKEAEIILSSDPDYWKELLDCRCTLGFVYASFNKKDEAMLIFSSSLAQIRRKYGRNTKESILPLEGAVRIEEENSDLRKAVVFQRELLLLLKKTATDRKIIPAMKKLAFLLQKTGKSEESEKLYSEILEKELSSGSGSEASASAMFDTGMSLRQNRKFVQALAVFKTVLTRVEKEHLKNPDYLLVLKMAGTTCSDLGQYSDSEAYYKKALGYLVKKPDQIAEAEILEKLGLLKLISADYKNSEGYLLSAYSIREEHRNRMNDHTVTDLELLSSLYQHWNLPEPGIRYTLQLAAELDKIPGNHDSEILPHNSLGNLYLSAGDYERSLKHYQKSLDLCSELLGRNSHFTAKIMSNTAGVLKLNKKLDKALTLLENSLEILQKNKSDSDAASVMINIGEIHQELGSFTKASDFYSKALQILKNTADTELLCSDLYGRLAGISMSSGDFYRSCTLLLQALESYYQQPFISQNNRDIPEKLLSDALYSFQKIPAVVPIDQDLISSLFSKAFQHCSAASFTKADPSLFSGKTDQHDFSEYLLISQKIDSLIKKSLALFSSSDAADTEKELNISTLRQKLSVIEKQICEKKPEFAHYFRPVAVSPSEFRQLLSEHDLLFFYVQLNNTLYCFTLNKSFCRLFYSQIDAARISALISNFNSAFLKKSDWSSFKIYSRELRNLVFTPYIPDGYDRQQLKFLSSGITEKINFANLTEDDSGLSFTEFNYLSDQRKVTILSFGDILDKIRKNKTQKNDVKK